MSPSSRLLAVAATAALLAACGGQGPSGVAMSTVRANVVFGSESPPPSTAAGSADQGVAQAGDAGLPDALPPLDLGLPDFGFPDFGSPDFGFPSYSTGDAGTTGYSGATCPPAPDGSVPASVADTQVTNPPASGTYLVIQSGQYQVTSGTVTVALPLISPVRRYVLPATKFADTTPALVGAPSPLNFTYDTVEYRNASSGPATYYRMHWQLKSNSTLPHDPEAGLVLKGIDIYGADGKKVSTYFASGSLPGLLVAPLPVVQGTTWSSVVTDAANSRVIKVSGTVGAKATVDACGKLIQAWQMQLTLNDGPDSSAVTMLVAPQYGGLVVGTKIAAGGTYLGLPFSKDTSIHDGQIDPSPLVAPWK